MSIRVFNPFLRTGQAQRATNKIARDLQKRNRRILYLAKQIEALCAQIREERAIRDALSDAASSLALRHAIDPPGPAEAAGNVVQLEART